MARYTDYCTCYYLPERNKVVFYDEIKECSIGSEVVTGAGEAQVLMQQWQANAPEDVICDILR